MIKYSIPLLFFMAISLFSCNGSPTTDQDATGEQLTAFAVPPATVKVDTTIDSSYKTTILEADLPSPRKEMTGNIDNIHIRVNYGSPSIKGRDVWGTLVPYGKVWRTGANEATTFTIDQAVRINGESLAAGTYGLFTLPGKDSWQFIFNATAEQWGAYEYDEAKDVLRIPAKPAASEASSEMVDFIIEKNKLVLLWEKVKIPVLIEKM